MRFFYDTEFIEDGKTIDLISIGVVAEDGREFYAQNMECDFSRASDWVRENVLPSLTNFDLATLKPIINPSVEGGYGDWYNRASLACHLRDVVVSYDRPEWWGYYSAYDHVALCQLFGRMVDLPKGWPFYTRDLKQWADDAGVDLSKEIPQQDEHHALADAQWNRKAWCFLDTCRVLATT